MNKKQKRALIEILITILMLVFCKLIYPLIVERLQGDIEKGLYFYINIALYVITYLIIGGRIVLKSLKNISKGRIFDEFFLMSLATIVAFILQDFFEGVAVMLFYQIGELFQSLAVSKSRESIKSLMSLAPTFANRITEEGKIEVIDVDEVEVDDILLIKVGEKIPVDSVILEGQSTIDNSSLTGESLPIDVKENDEVISGSINLSAVIKVKAKTNYEDSSIYKILTLIEEANESKGKTEQFITKFAKYYTPVVVFLALFLAIIPPLFNDFQFKEWIMRAMTFLVISCPCALVISIPLAFFSGIGKASKKGILVKGGTYLEELNKVKTMFFDKTGTLTEGKFTVSDMHMDESFKDYAPLVKGLEMNSSHPLAKAICEYFKDVEIFEIEEVKEISGRGMKGVYESKTLLCGNDKLLKENSIAFEDVKGTVIYFAYDNVCIGYFILKDQLKKDTLFALKELRKNGINELIMLTGDKEEPARDVSSFLGLSAYYAELLPNEKLEIVKKYKDNKKVGYVGDGINDAPTLVSADVSFAMGKNGTSLAMESADIVLMDDSLYKVALSKKYARQTMIIAYLNIVLSLVIKLLCLILGAFGIGGMLLAIFADVGVMIICVINSITNYYLR